MNNFNRRRLARPSRRSRIAAQPGAESLERRVMLRSSPLSRLMQRDAIIEAVEPRADRLASADLLGLRPDDVSISRGTRARNVPRATQVPGVAGSTASATFTLIARRASYRNEVGLFAVDDAAGRIGGVRPGDRGYAVAALQRARVLFRGDHKAGAVAQLELPGGSYFGTYLVRNGSSETFLARHGRRRTGGRAPVVFFSFTRSNPDRVVHVLQPRANLLRMEDRWRGGDRDFDDAVIRMSFAPSSNRGPSTAVRLARDTARGGLTNDDRITSDPSLIGTVVDPEGDAIRALRLRLDGDASAVDATRVLLGDGAFSLDRSALESALGRQITDGPHVVQIQAEDVKGASSPWTEFSFTLDTTPPPLTLALAPAFDSAPVGDGAAQQDVARLIGRTEPGLVVALGATGRTARADESGTFAFDDVPLLLIGSNRFVATTDDVAGNASEASLDVTGLKPSGLSSLDGFKIDPGDGDGEVTLEDGRIVLREGTSFQVALSRTFVVPEHPTTIDFRYEDLSFDTSDGGFINDAFEVALLGDNGRSVVPTFTSGRDAFFNVTEGLQPAVGAGVAQAGATVTLDVSDLIPGTTATLVFRLVNNDDDTRTSVAIVNLDAGWEDAADAPSRPTTAGVATPSALATTQGRAASFSASSAGISALAAASSTGDGLLGPDGAIVLSTTADFLAGQFTNTVATDDAGGIRLAPDSQRPTGSWSRVVDGGRVGVNWGGVTVEAETPPGSTVQTRVRADDDRDALATTPWTVASDNGRIPGVVGRFLEIETRLRSIADEGTADVVFVVDESGSMAGEQQWLASTIVAIDSQLGEYGFQNNRYGLVGFADTARSLPSTTSRFMNAQEFATAAKSLTTSRSGTEDGYGGIAYALREYGFRDDAVGVIVLVTDEDRDVVDKSLTRDDLLGTLMSSDFIFHAVLNATLVDDARRGALGVDSSGLAYLQGEVGDYTEGSGGTHVRSDGNTLVDYVDLAWAAGGTVWDLNKLRDGGEAAEAFTNAFVDGLPLQAGNTPIVKSITIQEVTPPTIEVFSPEDGASLPTGAGFVLSGRATADQAVSPTGVLVRNAITLVTVNGKPVDALDGAGRFFFRAVVRPGDNVFTIVAEDVYGQTSTTTLTVVGTQAAGVDFSMLSDVSASFDVDYARTSFRKDESTLYADVAVKNVGQYAVTTPLYVAITNLSDPTVAPLDADGYTPDGLPYYDVSTLVAGGRLEAGQTADPFAFSFWNPKGNQFDYELRFFGLLNRAPVVTTVPVIEALSGKPYRYDLDAADPDGDPVSFRLSTAPAGMTIDPASGVVSWTPAETGLGTHAVVIRVDDGRGGWTEQTFDVEAIVPPPNRPPVFTSIPLLDAQVGGLYTYVAAATDPDFDPLTFSLVAGPEGMTVDPATGLVSWTPSAGQQGEIALRVQDGRGGEVDQVFSICVAQAPGNHAPVIVSQPVTRTSSGEGSGGEEEVIDLGGWKPVQYDLHEQGSANWSLSQNNTVALQSWNADASILLSDFNLTSDRIKGTWRVDSNGDDDYMGFVFGYQDSRHFYLFDWKQSDQGDPLGFAERGMSVKIVDSDSDLTGSDLWPSGGNGDRVRVLYHNTVAWQHRTDYEFELEYRPGTFSIIVRSGSTELATIELEDDTYEGGKFGFYNYSQDSVLYAGFRRQVLPESIYGYNVAAIDPDGDALSYSLVQSPGGMSINPQTGSITWNPKTVDLGKSIPIVVRVEDGRGGFDEQSFVVEVGLKQPLKPGRVVVAHDVNTLSTSIAGPQEQTFAVNLARWLTGGSKGKILALLVGQDSTRDYAPSVLAALNEAGFDVEVSRNFDRSLADLMHYDAVFVGQKHPDNAYFDNQVLLSYVDSGGSVYLVGGVDESYSNAPLEAAGWRDFLAGIGLAYEDVYDYFWSPVAVPGTHPLFENVTTLASGNGSGIIDLEPSNPRTTIIATAGGKGIYATYETPTSPALPPSATGDLRFTSEAPLAVQAGLLLRYETEVIHPAGSLLTFDLPTAPAGMTVHPTLGVVVWTPTADQMGEHAVVLRVQDDKGGVALQSFTVTVGAANTAPVVSSAPPGPATVGLPYRYAIAAQDAEGDALTFAFDGQAPDGMTLSPEGVLDWSSAVAAGDYPVAILVTDARGASTRHAFTLKVAPAGSPNTAPTMKVDARTTAHAGQPYAATIRASDPDGDPLSYELISKPEGMAVDAAGLITWTPTADQLGGFDVEVKVSDGRPGGDVIRTFHVDIATQGVNNAPRVVSVPRLAATAGNLYATTLRGADPDGDPVSFRLISGPRGMSLDSATGAIRWTPSFDQLGTNEIVVEAVDPLLAASSQQFVVVVACANQGPEITSRPPTEAWVGDPYVYGVRADDPEGDALTFTPLAIPPGMTLDASGVIRWTPNVNQGGQTFTVAVQASDESGNLATQSFQVVVAATPRNRPPVITSRPSTVVVVDETYHYAAAAIDPEGDPLRFDPGALFPAGMTIDPASGVVSWPTSLGDLGSHIVTIVAVDAGGTRATQSFLLDVQENQAPTLRSAADPGPATAGSVFRYDVRATDPNGDALSYELVEGPAGMTVDQNGRIIWAIPADAVGPRPVEVVVRDPRGAEAVRSFVLNVQPDTNAPQVYLHATPGSVNPGSQVVFQVVATDDVLVKSLSLTVNGKSVVLGPDGTATVVMTTIGSIDARATATDPSGNVGDAAATVLVVDPASSNAPPPGGSIDPNDHKSPTVVITSPAFEASVSDKTPIIGTIDDPEDRLWYYRVLYARVDAVDLAGLDLADPDWTLLRQGTSEIHDGELALFDPTHLSRDPYAIVVAAYDRNGQGYVARVTVDVRGGLLLGNYHFETTDLQVPLAGIPITVSRVYDTTNAAREGDFGYGWSLGVQDARILETVPAGQDYVAGKTKVYLTAHDGRRIGFTYQEKVVGGVSPFFGPMFGAVVEPYFTPDPGVYETLQVPDTQVGRGGIIGAFSGPFNPDVFILTTKDGMRYTYDQAAGLKRVDDLNGNFVTFSDQGVQHSSGARIDFTRDYRGRITSITQYGRDGAQSGNPIRYRYDAAGDLRVVTDQGGLTTSYEYRTSPRHYLDRAIDARGVTVLRVEYEPIPDMPGALRFVALKDALGNVVGQNDYSGLDSHTAIVRDANGNEKTLLYDDRGNVLRETDALGNVTTREYNDPGNPDLETRIIDGRGYITDREYDARGNITKVIERGSDVSPLAAPIVTTLTYDDRNNVRTITNALGQTTSFTHDAKNNPLAIVNAEGNASRFTYDALGRKKTFTDFNGNTSLFEYASEDCGCVNPRKITYADGTYQTYKFNQFGQATEEAYYEADGTLVEITTTKYDDQGRVIEEAKGLNADRIVTRKVYDKNLLDYEIVVNPASPSETPATPIPLRKSRITDYDYDANGRMIRQTNPDGGAVDFRYDAQGNRVLLRDPVGNVTTWVYDADNRVVEERDPFYWAERGLTNLETIVAANRLPSGVDLAANRGAEHVTAHGYDANGSRIKVIDRNGRLREFSYDHAGRMTEERWYEADANVLARVMTWRYNVVGNLLEAIDPDSHYTYSYDTVGRAKAVDNAGTPDTPRVVLTYGYDKQGNVVSTSDDSGVTVASEYDARNRLSVRKWYDAVIPTGETPDVDPFRIDFHYNAASRQTLLERFAGLDRSTSAGRTVTTYYQTGQVDKLTHQNAVDAVLASYDYDYDFGGLVVGEARTNQDPQYDQTITYAYDLDGQLVDAGYDAQPDEHFEYDLNGNRIQSRSGSATATYARGVANRLASDGAYLYEYDGEGSLVKKTEVASGSFTTYEYDHRNRLVLVQERSAGGIIVSESRQTYDIRNRRISKEANGETVRVIHNGDNTWVDVDTAGDVLARYLFGARIDENLASWREGGDTVFHLTDRLGTARDLISSQGLVVNHAEFGAFGNVISQTNFAAGDRHMFSGREYDPDIQLNYYRARYFDPVVGKFISQDPLCFAGKDINLYRYAKNSPLNYIDPNGTIALSVEAAILSVNFTLFLLAPVAALASCIGEGGAAGRGPGDWPGYCNSNDFMRHCTWGCCASRKTGGALRPFIWLIMGAEELDPYTGEAQENVRFPANGLFDVFVSNLYGVFVAADMGGSCQQACQSLVGSVAGAFGGIFGGCGDPRQGR